MNIIEFFKKVINWLKPKKYFKLPDKRTVFWDIDNTLVRWDFSKEEKEKFGIEMQPGVWFVPHRRHIQLLRHFHATGLLNVLWSAGGADWADLAAKLLKIEDCVDAVVSKPTWYTDDLEAEEFMSEEFRIFKKDWGIDEPIV